MPPGTTPEQALEQKLNPLQFDYSVGSMLYRTELAKGTASEEAKQIALTRIKQFGQDLVDGKTTVEQGLRKISGELAWSQVTQSVKDAWKRNLMSGALGRGLTDQEAGEQSDLWMNELHEFVVGAAGQIDGQDLLSALNIRKAGFFDDAKGVLGYDGRHGRLAGFLRDGKWHSGLFYPVDQGSGAPILGKAPDGEHAVMLGWLDDKAQFHQSTDQRLLPKAMLPPALMSDQAFKAAIDRELATTEAGRETLAFEKENGITTSIVGYDENGRVQGKWWSDYNTIALSRAGGSLIGIISTDPHEEQHGKQSIQLAKQPADRATHSLNLAPGSEREFVKREIGKEADAITAGQRFLYQWYQQHDIPKELWLHDDTRAYAAAYQYGVNEYNNSEITPKTKEGAAKAGENVAQLMWRHQVATTNIYGPAFAYQYRDRQAGMKPTETKYSDEDLLRMVNEGLEQTPYRNLLKRLENAGVDIGLSTEQEGVWLDGDKVKMQLYKGGNFEELLYEGVLFGAMAETMRRNPSAASLPDHHFLKEVEAAKKEGLIAAHDFRYQYYDPSSDWRGDFMNTYLEGYYASIEKLNQDHRKHTLKEQIAAGRDGARAAMLKAIADGKLQLPAGSADSWLVDPEDLAEYRALWKAIAALGG